MAPTSINSGNLVGIEASNVALRAVLMDPDGSVLAVDEALVDKEIDRVPQIIDFIGHLRPTFGEFSSAGLALPGLIERASQRVAYSAHIPEHARGDLADEIRV